MEDVITLESGPYLMMSLFSNEGGIKIYLTFYGKFATKQKNTENDYEKILQKKI